MADWNDMASLVYDGRSVQFNSDAGIYIAAALPEVTVSQADAAIAHKPIGKLPDGTFGLVPDMTFNPTLWRDL